MRFYSHSSQHQCFCASKNLNQKFFVYWILCVKFHLKTIAAVQNDSNKIQLKHKRCIKCFIYQSFMFSRKKCKREKKEKKKKKKRFLWWKKIRSSNNDCNRSIIIVAVRSVIIAARWSTLIAVIAHAIIPIHGSYHEWWLPHRQPVNAHIYSHTMNDGMQSKTSASCESKTMPHVRVGITEMELYTFYTFIHIFFVAFLLQWPFFSSFFGILHSFCITLKTKLNVCQYEWHHKIQSNE